MAQIRKISVGSNFPDGCMYYQIGNPVKFNNISYTISLIEPRDDEFIIYISSEHGTVEWKRFRNMPITIENNINFE